MIIPKKEDASAIKTPNASEVKMGSKPSTHLAEKVGVIPDKIGATSEAEARKEMLTKRIAAKFLILAEK